MLKFYKYQGTGNDFILIDDRSNKFKLSEEHISQLCNRRFGIGADGLILLKEEHDYDFRMVYYNADGKVGSMCGNGGRCIVAFARDKGIKPRNELFSFLAMDGPHKAYFQDGIIALEMKDVTEIRKEHDAFILNTGSPHYVSFQENIDLLDVYEMGRQIRYSEAYKQNGINVNFVEVTGKNAIKVRTYERGVENETYSCGTGVVASALSFHEKLNNGIQGEFEIMINTIGGKLSVKFSKENTLRYSDVHLIGPAVKVFEGQIINSF